MASPSQCCEPPSRSSLPLFAPHLRINNSRILEYARLLQVPDCDSLYSQNVLDLYRVMRLWYILFREVLCIKVNNLSKSKLISAVKSDPSNSNAKNYFSLY